jgi:hypothetical protein
VFISTQTFSAPTSSCNSGGARCVNGILAQLDLHLLQLINFEGGTAHKHRHDVLRQHTSAYVSIRQHTSAYVSIRQHSVCFPERWCAALTSKRCRPTSTTEARCSKPPRRSYALVSIQDDAAVQGLQWPVVLPLKCCESCQIRLLDCHGVLDAASASVFVLLY